MTFDHDFGYSFPLFSSLLLERVTYPLILGGHSSKKREEEKENKLSIIVIKGHAFLLDLYF